MIIKTLERYAIPNTKYTGLIDPEGPEKKTIPR